MFHRDEKALAYAIMVGVLACCLVGYPEFGILPPVGYLLLKKARERRNKQLLLNQFPEFLFQLSSYLKYLPLEKALKKIEINEPFKQKLNEFSSRLETSKDISYASKVFIDSENSLTKLAARIIEIAYRTGKEMSYLIQSLGKEMIKEHLRNRDMEIGMLIEKYTLLIGGGLLVPAILGITFSFSQSLSISFPELGIVPDTDLNSAIYLANRIYLCVYSITIGIFLGKGKNRLIYILALLLMTQGVFSIASQINI